jgi:hypothetical protein
MLSEVVVVFFMVNRWPRMEPKGARDGATTKEGIAELEKITIIASTAQLVVCCKGSPRHAESFNTCAAEG